MNNFQTELSNKVAEVERILYRNLPEETGDQVTVLKAMNYAMKAGGKRIRPLLMQETHRLFGGDTKTLEPFMVAIEMIHTYSLVHDDLPALDNDDVRRGQATTHIVFGEDMAILTGDALLNYAYEIATRAFGTGNDYELVASAMKVLARKPGIYGMIGGQVLDVSLSGKEITLDQVQYIYKNKTSALLEASMMIGAILAGATAEQTAKIEQVAADVGIAFQIADDLLDILGDEEAIGKPTQSDSRNEKTTYVTLNGIEKSKEEVKILSLRAIQMLKELPYHNAFLEELLIYLIDRQS